MHARVAILCYFNGQLHHRVAAKLGQQRQLQYGQLFVPRAQHHRRSGSETVVHSLLDLCAEFDLQRWPRRIVMVLGPLTIHSDVCVGGPAYAEHVKA